MNPSPDNFRRKIRDILGHVRSLPDEARAPILHYRRTVADIWGTLEYVARACSQSSRHKSVVADRHLDRIYAMALVSLIEAFERFLKEAAAECVDALAGLVMDDRFNVFPVQGATLASHFGAGSAGRALCESGVWLDCREINDRFRRLLAEPFKPGEFYVFPKEGNQQPAAERWRFEIMSLVWQLRHTAVHNVGVITRSDAVKLQILSKSVVDDAPALPIQRRMISAG
jgi:hypothetical protein